MEFPQKAQVMASLRPQQKEAAIIEEEVSRLCSSLSNILTGHGWQVSLSTGGSFGKGTYLRGDHDIDIFVSFSDDVCDDELSEALGNALREMGSSPHRQKGSRDYFSLSYPHRDLQLNFEFVPVRALSHPETAENSTDVSIFHVFYVQQRISDVPELADEIRLMKQFLKAQGLYGAESYLQGFSGHVVDILVLYYGSFVKVLDAAKNWSPPVMVDITGTYSSYDAAVETMGTDKRSSLLVVDPILPQRNAAKALSLENLVRFQLLAKHMTTLGEDAFTIRYPTRKSLDAEARRFCREHGLYCIRMLVKIDTSTEVSEDIMGSKLLKAYERVEKEASQIGFGTFGIRSVFRMGDGWSLCYWFFAHRELSHSSLVQGPPVSMTEALGGFMEKHPEWWIANQRVMGTQPRRFTSLQHYAEHLSSNGLSPYLNKSLEFIKSLSVRVLDGRAKSF